MILLSPIALAALAAVAGAWLLVALSLSWRGRARACAAGRAEAEARKLAALLESGPAVPLLIEGEAVSGSARAAALLGLTELPERWQALVAESGPFEAEAADALSRHAMDAAASGAGFTLTARPRGSARVLRIEGGPPPPGFPPSSVLLWLVDVTETAEAATTLRRQLDERTAALDALSGLIEAAPFPIWHRGPDLALAMVNRAYVAAVEAGSAAEAVGRGIELIDESDGRNALREAAEVRDRQQPAHRTVPATISGARRMVQIVELPLGPSGVAGYAIDVEDQEQARAELARFVRAQRDMLDRLSAGVAQFGRDGNLIFFNQPFARLFSLTADFLADRPEFERVIDGMREAGNLPEVRDYPSWKAERRGWFTAGLVAEEEDWLLPEGKHLRVVAQPMPDGGLLLIFEDRTEQIQLASARDTLLRVRTATLDNLFEAIAVFASDGRLQLWNTRFRELWGFDDAKLSAKPRVDALTPMLARRLKRASHAGLMRELVRSATQERKQRSGRVALLDGREFEFAAVPLPDGNALFTMLDVTASRTVEAALRERAEALEQADRAKTAFVSNISYELRTPLTSIGGFAEMLAAGYAGDLPARAGDYVTAILESVGRLSAMIDNILDLTQSDTGGLLLTQEEVDVAELCEDAAEQVREAAEKKGLDFAIAADAAAGVVTGDRRRLSQALLNVLRNSIRYTDKGGTVELRSESDEAAARIIVTDTGQGIAPAEQSRVFDRFHRTAERQGGEEAAVGLGLPLARQFIEAHGGTIALRSKVGEGTTVTMTLPRARSERGEEAQAAQ